MGIHIARYVQTRVEDYERVLKPPADAVKRKDWDREQKAAHYKRIVKYTEESAALAKQIKVVDTNRSA